MSLQEDIERVITRTGSLKRNARDGRKILNAAAVYTIGSVERNFKAEGRPTKWKALAASTVRERIKAGKGGEHPIMTRDAHLRRMSSDVTSTRAYVGTNAVQAKRLHFGYPGGSGRGHAKTPARAFLLLQVPEDVKAIGKIFTTEITR